ncbi:hypothetical protein [Pelistega sp. MC2]|uniref:hypothetical protein n=1 Tax=Pelistega sp. MC2 TaxID=1720297 RepID=UPI0008DAC0A5|nr:hypothetical protein [Pelistega sp. MC2]
MINKKPKTLTVFVWDDAFGAPAGWVFEDEIEKTVSQVCSSGFLIDETDDTLTIAPHIGGNNQDRQQYAGTLTIPKRQITYRASMELSDLAPELALSLQDVLPQ